MSGLRAWLVMLVFGVASTAHAIDVVFQVDDAQDDNWEAASQAIFDAHMAAGVPLSLGVIPCANGSSTSSTADVNCIQDTTPPIFHQMLPNWIRQNPGMFEVVQHGTTHSSDERLENFSAADQRKIMSIGLEQMLGWNLPGGMPTAFNSPFASANQTTVDVAGDLGIGTFMKVSKTFSLTSDEVTIVVFPALACQLDGGVPVDGPDCNFHTPTDLVDMVIARAQELEDNGQNVIVGVLYHVQDVLISTTPGDPDRDKVDTTKVNNQLIPILQRFKQEENEGTFDLRLLGSFGKNPVVATAPDAGGGPHVRVFGLRNLAPSENAGFFAYGAAFTGGVRVASGDVNGDGFPDVVTAPGKGGGPHVRVFDVSGGVPNELSGYFPYPPGFTGGVFVATGDVDGDGNADVITGAGAGGGPLVRVFDVSGGGANPIGSFFAYPQGFGGGVQVAAADVDGDGGAEIITGAGPGGGPHVRVFKRDPSTGSFAPIGEIMAYAGSFRGGVFVGAGDVDGDGRAEVITAPGQGGGPHVRVFRRNTSTGAWGDIANFFAYGAAFTGGVRVDAADLDLDGMAEVITGPGPGGGPHVRAFDIAGGSGTPTPLSFLAYGSAFTKGIFVGGNP